MYLLFLVNQNQAMTPPPDDSLKLTSEEMRRKILFSSFFYGTDEVDPRRKRSKETLLPLELDVKVRINGENWFGIALGEPVTFKDARSECAKRNMSIPNER